MTIAPSSTMTHGSNDECPNVKSGQWTRCHGHKTTADAKQLPENLVEIVNGHHIYRAETNGKMMLHLWTPNIGWWGFDFGDIEAARRVCKFVADPNNKTETEWEVIARRLSAHERALVVACHGMRMQRSTGANQNTVRSLVRKGVIERYKASGRVYIRLTPAGAKVYSATRTKR